MRIWVWIILKYSLLINYHLRKIVQLDMLRTKSSSAGLQGACAVKLPTIMETTLSLDLTNLDILIRFIGCN